MANQDQASPEKWVIEIHFTWINPFFNHR